MTETEARQVLLVQAFEAGAESALWTAEDRAWATRLAQQTAAADGTPERFVIDRARHALQRLLPRDAAARRWLGRRAWRPLWVPLAALAAFGAGVALDHIGAPQRVDLLSPPVWAVVAWNLVVMFGLLLPHPSGGLRRRLANRWRAGEGGIAALWARHAAPLSLARLGLVMHGAAAAFALGIVAGMYLRGLVLDYRAGWQSTFLDAALVQSLLTVLLAPAAALTGLAIPDVVPLRVTPGVVAATASAAPWIHLYAATLALFVVLPRGALALAAAWRARALARRFPLPLQGPYFERLRLQQQGGRARVQVLPHGLPVPAQAALGLRAALATVYGDELQLHVGPVTPYGDEETAAALAAEPGATLRLALFDLGASPEGDVHGRFIDALSGPLPLLVVADEAAFRRRFGTLPDRLAERRAAWQRLADAHGAALLCADLDAPDLALTERVLKRVLGR
jgi:hypothetical protein